MPVAGCRLSAAFVWFPFCTNPFKIKNLRFSDLKVSRLLSRNTISRIWRQCTTQNLSPKICGEGVAGKPAAAGICGARAVLAVLCVLAVLPGARSAPGYSKRGQGGVTGEGALEVFWLASRHDNHPSEHHGT